MQSFLKKWFPEVMHFTDIYCSLKITDFPYFILKFAFGQPTNHGSVGYVVNYLLCGISIQIPHPERNNTAQVLLRPFAGPPHLLKRETKFCSYNTFKTNNMPRLYFYFLVALYVSSSDEEQVLTRHSEAQKDDGKQAALETEISFISNNK